MDPKQRLPSDQGAQPQPGAEAKGEIDNNSQSSELGGEYYYDDEYGHNYYDDYDEGEDEEEMDIEEDHLFEDEQLKMLEMRMRKMKRGAATDSEEEEEEEGEEEEDEFSEQAERSDDHERDIEDHEQEEEERNNDPEESIIVYKDGEIGFPEDKPEPLPLVTKESSASPLTKNKEDQQKLKPLIYVIEGINRAAQDNMPVEMDSIAKQAKVKEAMRRRKKMRYIAYATYLVLIPILLALAFKFLTLRSSFSISSTFQPNLALQFKLDNCTLYILDPEPVMTDPVYVKYQVPSTLGASLLTYPNEIVTENSLSLEILNEENPIYCLVQLFIKADITPIGSLEISCGHCYITQDTSTQLQINGLLNITGEDVHTNFKDVKVGSLSYQAVTGYLQLNNINAAADEPSNIVLSGEGDIIIQSTQDFVLNATTNTQAFCFGGINLISRDNGTCAYSDQNQQAPTVNTSCSLSWSVCMTQECNSNALPTFLVTSNTGNVYANAIPQAGTPVQATKIVSGQIYNNGIDLSSDANQTLSNFAIIAADQTKINPFVVLNLGDRESRSSNYRKWVVSSTSTYAIMRPWWIGTLSATVLNGYVEEVNGFLLPGFCPFTPSYTSQNLLEIQNLITAKVNTRTSIVTVVHDSTQPLPTDNVEAGNGIFPLIKKRNPTDQWLSFSIAKNGDIVIQDNNYSQGLEILAIILASVLIAIYVTYLALGITFASINIMYTKLVDFSNLVSNYSRIENGKTKKVPHERKTNRARRALAKSSLANILANAPSPLAFVDYLSLIVFQQFSNSVIQFYHLLIRERFESDEEFNPNQDMMKGTEVKLLYEKFCFVNHLTEQKLTDPGSIVVLRSYGFDISDLQSEVFTNVIIKNYDGFLVDSIIDENIDSLDLYISKNVNITQFEEDQVEVETFIRIYNEFCMYNRLPRISISPARMKEKYNINFSVTPQQYVVRNTATEDIISSEYPWIEKIMSIWKKGAASKKSYVIDRSKLENHFNLLMGNIAIMSPKQIDNATSDLILYPGWRLWDAITVLFHLTLGALMTLPLLSFVILNESQYEPWSLKQSLELIRLQDLYHDPAQLFVNLYHCFTWNKFLMVLATILWIVSFFNLILYYAIMEFPQDRSFKKSARTLENPLQRRIRQLEWIFVMITLASYFSYIGLVLTWLLLSAFINPTAFLPFASAAVTFVVFIVTKYNYFKNLAAQGTKAVITFVNKLFSSSMNKVLDKIIKNMERVAPALPTGALTVKGVLGAAAAPGGRPEDSGVAPSASNGLATSQSARNLAISEVRVIIPSNEVPVSEALAPAVAGSAGVSIDPRFGRIQKIREECAKREIPKNLIDLMIDVASKDQARIKKTLKEIITDLNTKLGKAPEGMDIMIELLFPHGIKEDETVHFITRKIINQVFSMTGLDKMEDMTPENLIATFSLFTDADEGKYDLFIKNFKSLLLDKFKNLSVNEAQQFYPILDIVSILAKDKPEHWDIKYSCFKLFHIVEYLLKLKPGDTPEDLHEAIEGLVKFLPLIFSVHEVPYDIDTKKVLDPQDLLKVIRNFCITIELFDRGEGEGDLLEMFFINFIYLAMAMIRLETHDLPRSVTMRIEEMFRVDIPSSKFFPFSLNMMTVIFNSPELFYSRMNKCMQTYEVTADLKNLLKILICYQMEDFERHNPNILVEKNPYLIKIAQSLSCEIGELIGLIDMIYGKKESKYIRLFLKAILTRMGLDASKLDAYESLMNIFFSKDQDVLTKAILNLKLDHGEFLLVGKRALNPKSLSEEDFRNILVTEEALIEQKDTVYYTSPENYGIWLEELKKNLNDNLSKYTKYKNEYQEKEYLPRPDPATSKANLAKFYLGDWKSFVYSKKNLTSAVNTLNTGKNGLKGIFIDTQNPDSPNGIDFLTIVMSVCDIRLEHGKRFGKFDKDKERTLSILAQHMGLNAEGLGNFVKMFVLKQQEDIVKSLLYFFPEEDENQQEINKIFAYSFRQLASTQKQISFINKELPESIQLAGNPIRVPPSLIKKICFDGGSTDLTEDDFLEILSLKIDKFNIEKKKARQRLFHLCSDFNQFSEAKTFSYTKIGIKNPTISSLFRVIQEDEITKRRSMITRLIPDVIDWKKIHPVKIAIAFTGILTGTDFNVYSFTENSSEEWFDDDKNESIKIFLGRAFNIYPEAFDLFEIIFERDATKFLQKSLPIIRRLTASSMINTSILESLFALSMGEHFNPHDLGTKLRISPDIIDFFITLIRLSKKATRRKELKTVADSFAVKKSLPYLKIKINEFVSITKLIFNAFDIDEAEEILANLGMGNTDNDDRNVLNADLVKGLIKITTPTDVKVDILKNRRILNNLRTKTQPFLNSFDLDNFKNNAFIISRLATGNFLVLDEYKNDLSWLFPTHDEKSQKAIIKLTMAICGLLNVNTDTYPELNAEVETYVAQYYSEGTFIDKEPSRKAGLKALPNNSLAYAIYLAFQTLDIPPKWTQAFLLDKRAFMSISKHIPSLKEEFVIAMVLQMRGSMDVTSDLFTLYDWTIYLMSFYQEEPRTGRYNDFINKIGRINLYFEEKMNFDYFKIKEIANKLGLLQDEYWPEKLIDEKTFNTKVNQSFFFLLTRGKDIEERMDLARLFRDDDSFSMKPVEFLERYLKNDKATITEEEANYSVGEAIRKMFYDGYEVVREKIYKSKPKVPNFALGDLCTLNTLMILRSSSQYSLERKLYNLHVLGMNIERKLLLDDSFFKLSKYKLMKLAGISIGTQVSNIFEYCSNPSLFTRAYSWRLEMAQTEEQRNKIKWNKCKLLLTMKEVYPDDETEEVDEHPFFLADLGYYGGRYIDVINFMDEILCAEDWEQINMILELEALYLKHPQAENVMTIINQEEEIIPIFEKCKASDGDKNVINSQELIRLVFDEDGYKKYNSARLKYRNPIMPEDEDDEEDQTKEEKEKSQKRRAILLENLVDIKTGLYYRDLLFKAELFEKALMNPNMIVIQGIIRGDPSQILKGEHILNSEGKMKANLYMAVIGLQSYMERDKKDKASFKNYLSILSNSIESDLLKLEEILNFIMTRKRQGVMSFIAVLSETINCLQIDEDILELLLISLEGKSGTKEEEEEEEELDVESKFSLREIIAKNVELSDKDMDIFELMRKIYLMRETSKELLLVELNILDSWVNLIKQLQKINTFASRRIDRHPLVKFIKTLDLAKLRKQVAYGQDLQIYKSMAIANQSLTEAIDYVFKEIILGFSDDDEHLIEHNSLTQLLIEKKFDQIFKMVLLGSKDHILSHENLESYQSPAVLIQDSLTKLKNYLKLFGVDTLRADKDIRMFRLFLTLAQENLSLFRLDENYENVINKVIDDIFEFELLDPSSDGQEMGGLQKPQSKLEEENLRKLARLIVGLIGWDFQLCIEAFASPDTLDEGFMFYSLYGCLNIGKLLSIKHTRKDVTAHLNALLCLVFPAILSKNAPAVFKVDLSKRFREIMIEQFNLQNITNDQAALEKCAVALANATAVMFKKLNEFNKANTEPKPLLHHLSQVWERKKTKGFLTLGKVYKAYEKIMASFYDSTILAKLLNTFVIDEADDHKNDKQKLKILIHLLLDFREYYSNKKTSDGVLKKFERLIKMIKRPDEVNLWEKVLFLAPKLLGICLDFQTEGGPDVEGIKRKTLVTLKELASLIDDPKHQRFIIDVMSIMMRTNINNIDKDETQLKIKQDLGIQERQDIFFDRVCSVFFTNSEELNLFRKWRPDIYTLIVKLKNDFRQKMKDPKSHKKIVQNLLDTLEAFDICSQKHMLALMSMVDGDFKGCESLIEALSEGHADPLINESKVSYLAEARQYLISEPTLEKTKGSMLIGSVTETPKPAHNIEPEEYANIVKKIKEGTSTSKDLFRIINLERDNMGTINESEFLIVARRLGLKLSSHRAKELFAKVKGEKINRGELNEEEFGKALTYLQEKNIQQAMEMLGITPEILIAALLRLVILLILIFIFIFLGIKAFAIGGTFGSLINSVFPAAGGFALGKENEEDKGKLQEDNVKEATDKSFDITTSVDL